MRIFVRILPLSISSHLEVFLRAVLVSRMYTSADICGDIATFEIFLHVLVLSRGVRVAVRTPSTAQAQEWGRGGRETDFLNTRLRKSFNLRV